MHIVIIGSGIAGLATYRFLQKHLSDSTSHTIKIYEAYPKTTRPIGGGLSLASNGVRALNALDPTLLSERLLTPSASFSYGFITLQNSYGTHLAKIFLGRKERYGFPNIMVSRPTLYSALEHGFPEGVVTYNKRVASIRELDNGKVEVEFEDGTLELADLVLGTDGVKSVVRPAVVGVGYEAQYRGLTGIGGLVHLDPLPQSCKDDLKASPVLMTFGRDGFFGYSPICSLDEPNPTLIWWSTFSALTPPPRDLPHAEIREQLLARHRDWVAPICQIIEMGTSEDSEVLVLPVNITPAIPRFTSSSGRIILLGDAAHAMPPDSGQGASLALEDSQTVALLLSHYLDGKEDEAEALRCTAEGFNTLRKERASRMLADAMRRGENKKTMTWWQEYIRNWVVWIVGWFPERWEDWKFTYTVAEEVDGFLKREAEQKN